MTSDDLLTCDPITAKYSVFQRARGHRFSIDDRATAFVAVSSLARAPQRALDLGTGIGSVLLMVASVFPEASLVGIEAQEESFALLEKNVAHNALTHRTRLLHGDLRERTLELPAQTFDLVTGTPPYLPLGTATGSPDPQRRAARIELRGGIEAYLAAAAHAVSDDGRVVVCADGRSPERTLTAGKQTGLHALKAVHAIAREGNPSPLFSVWTFTRSFAGALVEEPLVLRDAAGRRTEASLAIPRAFGLHTTSTAATVERDDSAPGHDR